MASYKEPKTPKALKEPQNLASPGDPPGIDEKERNRRKARDRRVRDADKDFKKWQDVYRPGDLEQFYLGHQWTVEQLVMGEEADGIEDRYTLDQFFPAIESRRPSILFDYPTVRISAKSKNLADPSSTIGARSKLLEDTASTYIRDRKHHFREYVTLTCHESFFAFGLMEVGYEANVTENPNAGKPVLQDGDGPESSVPLYGSDGKPVTQPDDIIDKEDSWFRRIPATTFRASSPVNLLSDCDWVGYYEWLRVEDIRAHPRYLHTSYLKDSRGNRAGSGGGRTEDGSATVEDPDAPLSDPASSSHGRKGFVKVWKIWDLRAKKKVVFAEDSKFFLLEEEFGILPLAMLDFHKILDSPYPLPPAFNWVSPQKEYNETRDAQRVHRKRFNRRYLVQEGTINESEMEKLESGRDGVYAFTNRDPNNLLVPVQDSDINRSVIMSAQASREDFSIISGIPGEARAASEADTATQARIMDVNSRIRGDVMRGQVAIFLSEVVSILLNLIIEKATLPQLVKTTIDMSSPDAPAQVMATTNTWREIQMSFYQGIDFEWEANVEVDSIAPPPEAEERESWDRILEVLTKPEIVMLLVNSEFMLRTTLRKYGIRNASEVAQIQQALQTVYMGMIVGGMMPPGGGGGLTAPGGSPSGPGMPPPAIPGPPAANGGGADGGPPPSDVDTQLIAQTGGAPGASFGITGGA